MKYVVKYRYGDVWGSVDFHNKEVARTYFKGLVQGDESPDEILIEDLESEQEYLSRYRVVINDGLPSHWVRGLKNAISWGERKDEGSGFKVFDTENILLYEQKPKTEEPKVTEFSYFVTFNNEDTSTEFKDYYDAYEFAYTHDSAKYGYAITKESLNDNTYPELIYSEPLDTDALIVADETYFQSSFDTQVAGAHYRDLVISPLRFIDENNLSFIAGNVIKYVIRAEKKGGAEDLKKSVHYLRMLLEKNYGIRSKVEYKDEDTGEVSSWT